MFLIGISIGFFITSFVLMLLTTIFPIMRYLFMDWIALILMFVPTVIILMQLSSSHCMKQADRLPKWKHLIKYLRRDNETVEVLGERAYPGESFVDIPLLGLIEYLGKDCYYNSGNKKYAWVLENMNFTPDPRYSNFTHILWKLGFSNSDEVKIVLAGGLPELRQKVYDNMLQWNNSHGVHKLNSDLENYDGKTVSFKPSPIDHDSIAKKIDKIKKIRFRTHKEKEQVW